MANVNTWEACFVRAFIIKDKRERYLEQLKGPKHRKKILDRLNHNLDFDESRATLLDAKHRTPERLLNLLECLYVKPTGYLMADGNRYDGQEVRLEIGVPEFLDHHWGAVLICPPNPIAIYKEEDIGRLFLLRKPG